MGTLRIQVVDKIIKGALAFKSLGDAAVAFDKSGYAALGWSVVSCGLQLAANAEDARELVLSSSEVVTRFMAKYEQYERMFRGPEAGEEFDRLLMNVYKALLLYMIALDNYLRQSGPGLSSSFLMAGFDDANTIFSSTGCACGQQIGGSVHSLEQEGRRCCGC